MRLVPGLRRPAALAAAAALLILSSPAQAQLRDTGFDLSRLDVSARTAGLAGAMGGLAGTDATVLFSNPAFLTGEMDHAAALGYVNHLSDINAGTAVYARSLPRFGVDAALGIRFLSYGDFERSGADGTFDGTTFGASEAAVTLTASRVVYPNLRVGGSGHALFASIDDASAQALALDLGATYEVPSQRLVFGASLNGVGTVLSSLGDDRGRDADRPADQRRQAAPLHPAHDLGRGLRASELRGRDGGRLVRGQARVRPRPRSAASCSSGRRSRCGPATARAAAARSAATAGWTWPVSAQASASTSAASRSTTPLRAGASRARSTRSASERDCRRASVQHRGAHASIHPPPDR